MTDEELALKAQAGDEAALIELWNNKRGLVYTFAKRRYSPLLDSGLNRGVDMDDFMQCGFLALMRAVKYYDPDKPFAFSTYVGNACKTEFDYLLRTREHSKIDALDHATSFDKPVVDNDETATLEGTLADPCDRIEAVEEKIFQEQQHQAIEKAFEYIPEKQSTALRLRYYKDKTMQEIGESMGLTYNQVRNILKYAFINMRKPEIRAELEPFIDLRTDFYRTGSVARQTSPVEENVIWRESLRKNTDALEGTA